MHGYSKSEYRTYTFQLKFHILRLFFISQDMYWLCIIYALQLHRDLPKNFTHKRSSLHLCPTPLIIRASSNFLYSQFLAKMVLQPCLVEIRILSLITLIRVREMDVYMLLFLNPILGEISNNLNFIIMPHIVCGV